jgi:hypothetical protein
MVAEDRRAVFIDGRRWIMRVSVLGVTPVE